MSDKIEIKIEKITTYSIAIYNADNLRCHPDCQYCYKDDGQYQCAKYKICVDNGDFEDTKDMYGFKRCDKCLSEFGTEPTNVK